MHIIVRKAIGTHLFLKFNKNPSLFSLLSLLFITFASMNRFIILLLSILSVSTAQAQKDLIQCEDTCMHIHGIDLSHYQGNVFWEAVGNNSKMRYVYLKATEGGDRIDDKYEQNIELAHQYGLKVGAYHFFRPKTDIQKQFDNFSAQCRPADQDLIPMVDIETTAGLPTEEFCDSLFKFIHLIEVVYKQKPLLYTFANFYDRHLLGKLHDYKVMIAQYTQRIPVLKDDLDFIMWQYTGKGHINGINGYVDKSRFMGDHQLREIRFRHR